MFKCGHSVGLNVLQGSNLTRHFLYKLTHLWHHQIVRKTGNLFQSKLLLIFIFKIYFYILRV